MHSMFAGKLNESNLKKYVLFAHTFPLIWTTSMCVASFSLSCLFFSRYYVWLRATRCVFLLDRLKLIIRHSLCIPSNLCCYWFCRNSEEFAIMKSPARQQQNNKIHTVASPDRECPGRGNNNNNGVPQTYPDDKKGSSSGSEGSIWPKFAITLSNREKEEDFLVFKGSKLPQRPKKRAKVIQRTVNVWPSHNSFWFEEIIFR